MNYLIVGAGFYGATFAQQLAENGHSVTIIDKRPHIAGNAYSEIDSQTGIEVHKYGSHLFHTSNKRVWDYANRFTSFNDYRHTVWANHNKKIYSMPINLNTINSFFEKSFTPCEAKSMLSLWNDPLFKPTNLEEKAISLIGKPLYDAFIKGYTEKQWQTDPKILPPEIISRLPVRYSFNNRYFEDTYEGLPINGYTNWVENMIDHKNIKVKLNIDFFDIKSGLSKDTQIVYTGPIDKYFNYVHGQLSWRTLDFEWEIHEVNDYQGTSVMNYSDLDIPYTRIHEFKHLHPERNYTDSHTIISKEYSRFASIKDEPYYPVNSESDRKKLSLYRDMVKKENHVIFGGRLGTYQYLDMHMAIASALSKFGEIHG